MDTRKYQLLGYFLTPPERRQLITLKREKNFLGTWIMGYGLPTGDGQTDMEFEIVF